ncbi:permease [Psychromicrobium xiongbiense]|uniref:permease n=1 Tax=Psychromicrobium xiongbiense TaxID=3051184 RepID=UPI0025536FF5|nr:permease [Psychromicrobium sp. YIM S02556]
MAPAAFAERSTAAHAVLSLGGWVEKLAVGLTSVVASIVLIGAAAWSGASGSGWPSLVVALLFGVILGYGWPHFLHVPARKTLGTVIALSAAISAWSAHESGGPAFLIWLVPTIALGVGAVFVVELIRGTGQSHRLESTFGAISGVVIAAAGAGWVALQRFTHGGELLLVAGIAMALVLLWALVPWPDRLVAPVGVVLGGLAAALAALLFTALPPLPLTVVGVVAAATLLSFRRLENLALHASTVARAHPVGQVLGMLAIGLAPVLSVGILSYFLDRLFSL